MRPCKKIFLFTVGTLSIALDEVIKSIEEATKSIEEERIRISGKFSKKEPNKS